MSIRKWACIVTAALMLPPIVLKADTVADAKKAIQLQYDRANASITKRDMAAMYGTYSPAFVAIDIKGHKYTLANLKQQTQKLFSQARTITGFTKIVSISVSGNTASVRVAEHTKMVGTDPATRTDSIILVDSTSDDVWVLNAGRWLQTKTRAKSSKATLNGRLIE